MTGLQKVLKLYGRMSIKDNQGKEVIWVWDYKNNKARIEKEMTKEEKAESERAKYQDITRQLNGMI